MASDDAKAKNEGLEHQDQSIKARKFQLFEGNSEDGDGVVVRPFSVYVRQTPAAPLSPVVKASLWATGVVVFLLFLAAMFPPKPKRRQAALTPDRPSASASALAFRGVAGLLL